MAASEVAFIAVKKRPPVEDPGVFSAVASCQPSQPSSKPGLHFRLVVTNQTDGEVELNNPYETISYDVTNAEGWPVATTAPVSRARVDGPRRPPSRAGYLGIEHVDVDGKAVAGDTAADEDTFTLVARGSITLDLVVPEVQTAYQATTTAPPAPGDYHLGVLLPLRWWIGDDKQSFMLRSESPLDITVTD